MQNTSAPGCTDQHVRHRADTVYLLLMAGRIISMQTGFAMLESAYARPMNSANIMMKNIFDLLLGAIVFYLFGYEIAFGGQTQFGEDIQFDFALWFLHLSYASTAATITSGALAGRVAFIPYLVLSIVITGIIYPVVVQWTWAGGWLGRWGFIDFAGSSIVHLAGAVSALVAVCICGPRIGKYPEYRPWKGIMRRICVERNEREYYEVPQTGAERAIYAKIKAVSNPVQLLFGVFLLLTGFLAFNPASTFSTIGGSDLLAARSTVVTLLTTAGGSLACFVASLVQTRSLVVSVPDLTNAVLGAMVASCAGCDVLNPLVGVFVGFVAALLALWCQKWLNERQIDDVVGAVAAHGLPAVWGVVSVALWAQPHCSSSLRGLAFGGGIDALELLGIQVVGLIAISAFVAVSTYFVLISIDVMIGFRSSRASELIGLDFMEHRYDDGSFGTDPNKVTVITESAMRDCLAQRMVRHLSPTKRYSYNSPAETCFVADSAGSNPPNAPGNARASSSGEASTEPAAERALESAADEPGARQPTGAPASRVSSTAPSSTSEVPGSGQLPSHEELAREVAALRAAVRALREQMTVLTAAAGADQTVGAALGAPSGSSLAGMGRAGALRQLLSDAEKVMAVAQTSRPNEGHAGRRV